MHPQPARSNHLIALVAVPTNNARISGKLPHSHCALSGSSSPTLHLSMPPPPPSLWRNRIPRAPPPPDQFLHTHHSNLMLRRLLPLFLHHPQLATLVPRPQIAAAAILSNIDDQQDGEDKCNDWETLSLGDFERGGRAIAFNSWKTRITEEVPCTNTSKRGRTSLPLPGKFTSPRTPTASIPALASFAVVARRGKQPCIRCGLQYPL